MAQGRIQTDPQIHPRRQRPHNDNGLTPLSKLSFRAQRRLEQRQVDLAWQIRFAKMKLHHWRNPDNWNWDSLEGMLSQAETELSQFG